MSIIEISSAIAISALSGLAGVGLQKHWSKSKPLVAVTALGFEGDIIEVPSELITLADKCVWSERIENFIDFKELLLKERNATQVLAALQKTKEIVDNWLDKVTVDVAPNQFTKNKLLRSPIISDGRLINATVMGSIKRKDFPDLPMNLNEYEDLNNIFPLEKIKDQKGWNVHCGRFGINYRDHDYSEQDRGNLENLATSIAKGNVKNIIFLHEYYSNFAGAEIYNEEKLVKKLRQLIIENAKISMKVNISNLGQAPVIFKPYMAAKLVFGQESKSFVMKKEADNNKEKLKFDDLVRTEEFLHSSEPSSHITVSGGSSVDIKLISLEKIGTQSSVDIKLISLEKIGTQSSLVSEFYQLGGLQGAVLAKSLDNRVYSSSLVHFGKSITLDEQKSLLESSL
ncbi:hypothetical protein QFW85_13100 [Vibrio chagasii]|uniref:hypothetical protein n=1 Tax=Vibrio chagasii TaxID=170679 RepID=UPI003DA8087F